MNYRFPIGDITTYHFGLTLKIPISTKCYIMNNIRRVTTGLLLTLSLCACDKIDAIEQQTDGAESQAATTSSTPEDVSNNQNFKEPEKKLPKAAFKTIEWTDLMPKEDLDAFLNPPSYITDVEDGSFEDQISSQIQSSIAAATDDIYQQALVSTRVVSEMDGRAIRIPGFIVPLEFDDDQTITQFFLVPFFGACIHVPPPPPNQIIFVDYPEGLKLEALYDPFWISGVIKTSLTENQLASSAYSITMQYYEEYGE